MSQQITKIISKNQVHSVVIFNYILFKVTYENPEIDASVLLSNEELFAGSKARRLPTMTEKRTFSTPKRQWSTSKLLTPKFVKNVKVESKEVDEDKTWNGSVIHFDTTLFNQFYL